MPKDAEKVLKQVLKRVTPQEIERKKIENLSKKLEKKVAQAAEELGLKIKARVEGSVAKNTWLSQEPDIDVFMRVSKTIPRDTLGDVCLKIAKKATEGSKQVERFADHPYLEAFVENVRVNIVPCYNVKQGTWIGATDRTPFHTDYINKQMTPQTRDEVRLLKKFMKGVSVYGAEIKIGGFSGYLCELLILHYKSFLNTIKTFADYKQGTAIDIQGFYDDRQREIKLLFDEPLVVVDPIDKARNVASAVREQKLYSFIAAAQGFLKKPSLEFFYPSKTTAFSGAKMRDTLKKRGSKIVFVVFGRSEAVADILWGQLYKSQRSLRKLVELNDFQILRDLPWSNDKDLNMFIFELEDCCVPLIKKHLGPPLDKEKECEKFVSKYVGSPEAVSGPYVAEGRWMILARRKFTDACDLLKDRLKDGGRNAGVAEGISQVLKEGFKVLVNDQILEIYERSDEFAAFLTEFLQGKPKWLEAR